MAKEKELTREEARVLNVKKTLESKFIQGYVGSSDVKANPFLYGQLGLQGAEGIYSKSFESKEAKEIGDKLYNEEQKEKERLGVLEEVPLATRYDIAKKIVKQYQEVLDIAKIGELEDYAKKAGAKLNFEVPKELKNYSRRDIIAKYIDPKTGRIDLGKLNQKEQDAWRMVEVLGSAYTRACAVKASSGNYFADINELGNKISESYKKE